MIWWLLPSAAFLGAFLVIYKFRHKVSPRAVLMAALPLLGFSLLLQFGGWGLPTGVGSAAASENTFDLSGRLFNLDGKSVDATDFGGKIIFINFWATWCGPCRAEMPSMAKLYQELNDDGFAMLAITDEKPETVRKYLEDTPYPFTFLLDPEAILFQRLRVRGLPTTFVFNDKNELLLEHVGGHNWGTPELIAEFRRMLKEGE